MTKPTRVLLSLLLGTVSLAVALAAAEISLRLLDRPPGIRSGWYSSYRAAEENEMRFRGRPIEYDDEDYVIVLLGDSQVEAKACAYAWMPERRLAFHLSELTGRPVKVFTLGAAGYGQDQQALVLKRYLARYRADHVALWLTMTNDVKDNTWPTHTPIDGRPKPTFWLADGELRGPHQAMNTALTPRFRLRALLKIALGVSRDARWESRRLPPAYEPLEAYEGPSRRDWQRLVDRRLLSPVALRMEKSDKATLLTPRSERTLYGITLTNRLLNLIRSMAIRHDARFTVFGVDKGDRTDEIDGVYAVEGQYYRASSRQYWDNVGQITEGLDFHLIPVREPHWQAGPLDHHLNEHATDDVMRELAGLLAEEVSNDPPRLAR